MAFLCVAARRRRRRSVGRYESCFKREQPCSQTVTGATQRQRAFFSFPPLQQRPTSGPNAVRSVGHLNAVHKGFRLPHRTLDRELRTTVLMSGLSFSFEYAALAACRKSVPFWGILENRHIVVDKSIATGSPKCSVRSCEVAEYTRNW